MASLNLYTFKGDFRAFKALIAAQYNGVEINVPDFDPSKDLQKPEFQALSPLGKVPILETTKGGLFESNAIARYVARLRADTELTGASFFESAQVDSWLDFCSNQVELAATLWVYPILGFADYNEATFQQAQEDLLSVLAALEDHLLLRTFLVGNSVTLADIAIVSALLYPFKFVLDGSVREQFPSVTRWFVTCVNQPQFRAVVGDVPLCEKALLPAGAPATAAKGKKVKKAKEPKKAEAKKAEAKKAKKEAAPAPAPAPEKKKGPFADLPPTKMSLDAWKSDYSNSRGNYYASMEKFWNNHFDAAGWSVWTCDYQYNNENQRDFMTSNLVGGFIQRSDQLRKYAFGVMQILNEKAPYEVTGCWLFRGHDVKPMLDANPDAEYYTWKQLDTSDESIRKLIGDYWCAEEELMGKKIYDSQVFK